MNVGILIIATNKYKQFVDPLVRSIGKYMFVDKESGKRLHSVIPLIFSDELYKYGEECPPPSGEGFHYLANSISAVEFEGAPFTKSFLLTVPSYKFPEATLYRYSIFNAYKDFLHGHFDRLIYMDVDSLLVDFIDNEDLITGDLVAVSHPGFYMNKGWGSEGDNPESATYLIPEYRNNYVCGGIQGGKTDVFLNLCRLLTEDLKKDQEAGITPIWHDETMFNYYVNYKFHQLYPQGFINILSPEYCMVENRLQRVEWGIDNIKPKILALDKNHNEIRK